MAQPPRPSAVHVEPNTYEPIPATWTIRNARAAIPPKLFERNIGTGLTYLARDVAMIVFCAMAIRRTSAWIAYQNTMHSVLKQAILSMAWMAYWWFQGLILTGLWVLGHECGHGAFSKYQRFNNILGFVIHTSLWTPYFSWKISHHRHHMANASMERDQVYVPKTRSDLGLPADDGVAEHSAYEEILGDTPIYAMFMLIRQQLLGFPAYLMLNISGPKAYPRWTNHFNPNAVIFSPTQRWAVIVSDLGLIVMMWLTTLACAKFGTRSVILYYGVPWLAVTNWFIMVTYLQHTSPDVPHYRKGAWTFPRGAIATVDRDFLGWQGRFFLHGVAHYHVVHHFFPKIPFYNCQEATEYLSPFLGHHYRYSDQPTFKALWTTYNMCQFVEDRGDVVFYKDRLGRACYRPASN